MENYEKLGSFYLGRPFDIRTDTTKPGILLYDSSDLVTHAVCVGMTGSGKTGLCITLLEEAAIDGIPAIVIDPKGDLGNLLLTFPNLTPEDFLPWVESDAAQKKGLTVEQYAAQQADLWRKGLSDWGQDAERIAKLRNSAEFSIYTPGSNSGIPISILKSFAAPATAVLDDHELMSERVNTTATSLLGLLGLDADPIKSREHILISTILHREWSQGNDLDIASLIQKIQTPSVTTIGVIDLESFFPSKDRFELALALNNLLAAPAFSDWMEGEPLDVQNLLYTSEGKPRIAIFSIAHLSDSQRMFFVSLLLNQTLGWMRTQSGTTSLRAILYMDEIFGYFPPVANPPSKLPLLTLLKQGRAFGLGVVLATQNPVDLDYKGLANAGTWFIGRLQTERDKARMLEGLEGIANGSGQPFARAQMEELLAGLTNRIFLLHNVHEDGPEIFQTRWAMSYLRGPLTRSQIKTLMDDRKKQLQNASVAPINLPIQTSTTAGSAGAAVATAAAQAAPAQIAQPVLPSEIPQYFVPVRGTTVADALIYQPMLLAIAEVRYVEGKTLDVTQNIAWLTPLNDGPIPVDWDQSQPIAVRVEELQRSPAATAQFSELPSIATKEKSYDNWQKEVASWIHRNQRLELLQSQALKLSSNPNESERDFRVRLQQIARELRDQRVEKLRQRYAPKLAALEEKQRRAEQAVARETEQSQSQKIQTAISFGATLLSSFMGRKKASLGTLGRATTAARGVSRSMKEAEDVTRVQETLAAVSQQLSDLESQFQAEIEALEKSVDAQTEQLEKVGLKPTKANIAVKLVTLAWAPYWPDQQGAPRPAWQGN